MAAIKKNGDIEYMDGVKFSAQMSESTYCLCEGCHNSSRVIKLSYPYTLYHVPAKGLSTRYRGMWLCKSCYEKLMNALEVATWDE